MLFAIFVIVIVVEVILTLLFAREAQRLVAHSHSLGCGLFGRNYGSTTELYMDFNFLNDLFDGSGIANVENQEIEEQLCLMRRILIGQIVGGLLFFFLGILLGVTSS
jgi:hypothetical protein